MNAFIEFWFFSQIFLIIKPINAIYLNGNDNSKMKNTAYSMQYPWSNYCFYHVYINDLTYKSDQE